MRLPRPLSKCPHLVLEALPEVDIASLNCRFNGRQLYAASWSACREEEGIQRLSANTNRRRHCRVRSGTVIVSPRDHPARGMRRDLDL